MLVQLSSITGHLGGSVGDGEMMRIGSVGATKGGERRRGGVVISQRGRPGSAGSRAGTGGLLRVSSMLCNHTKCQLCFSTSASTKSSFIMATKRNCVHFLSCSQGNDLCRNPFASSTVKTGPLNESVVVKPSDSFINSC